MTALFSAIEKTDPTGLNKKIDSTLGLGAQALAPPVALPPTPITPPPPDSGATSQSANVQAEADKLRERQGRAANSFTGATGVNTVPVGTKVLFGS